MKLNLGVNRFYANGWINVDLRPHGDMIPDLIHDIRNPLPFAPGCIDAVYCGHILEHLTPDDCIKALDNIRAVLKPGGFLGVVGPDIELARANFPEAVPDILGGSHEGEGDDHLWVPTLASTVELLEDNGWQVTPFPIEAMPDRWPVVSRIGWQFSLEAQPLLRKTPSRATVAKTNTRPNESEEAKAS